MPGFNQFSALKDKRRSLFALWRDLFLHKRVWHNNTGRISSSNKASCQGRLGKLFEMNATHSVVGEAVDLEVCLIDIIAASVRLLLCSFPFTFGPWSAIPQCMGVRKSLPVAYSGEDEQ